MEGIMHPYIYAVLTSADGGATWATVTTDQDTEGYTNPAKLASDTLDSHYRDALLAPTIQPVPLLAVHVYDGPAITAPAIAAATIGEDGQWQATGRLLAEIAADLRHFEDEKKALDAQLLSTQTAIGNARTRLENVTRSAVRMGMPQIDIAHAAGRSREWVRKTGNLPQESEQGQKEALQKAVKAAAGTWNTRRAANALAEAGHMVTDKRARQLLRDLAAAEVIAKTDPNTATYRTTEQ
ncbi:hypothetical protein ABZ826_23750 [Streptomyces sp. NPDC047515]|uniref:hypothetical protein n=1 Tax=Streptomyces sp. NPDC047515 TaxID=3155380 RepID=UPI0033DB8376